MGAYFFRFFHNGQQALCSLCFSCFASPTLAGSPPFGYYTTDTVTTLPSSLDEFDLWYPNPYYWSPNALSSRTLTYADSTYVTYWSQLTTGLYEPGSSGYYSSGYFDESSAGSIVLPLGIVTVGALLGAM